MSSILDELFNEISHKAMIAMTTDKCLSILAGAYAITLLGEDHAKCKEGKCSHTQDIDEFMNNARQFLLEETNKINKKGKPNWENWTKEVYLASCKRSVDILEGNLTFTFGADKPEVHKK